MRLNGDELPLCRLGNKPLRLPPADRDLTTMRELEVERIVTGARLVELDSLQLHLPRLRAV